MPGYISAKLFHVGRRGNCGTYTHSETSTFHGKIQHGIQVPNENACGTNVEIFVPGFAPNPDWAFSFETSTTEVLNTRSFWFPAPASFFHLPKHFARSVRYHGYLQPRDQRWSDVFRHTVCCCLTCGCCILQNAAKTRVHVNQDHSSQYRIEPIVSPRLMSHSVWFFVRSCVSRDRYRINKSRW